MKLESKHITPYLDHELSYMADGGEGVRVLKSIDIAINMVDFGHGDAYEIDKIKPILRPLSDLSREQKDKGHRKKLSDDLIFINLGKNYTDWFLARDNSCLFQSYEITEYLFKHHFDIFGLIENNLAIDINTLTK